MSNKNLFKSIALDVQAYKPHFTSDLHLFHSSAARHREFDSIDDMHNCMEHDWNARVELSNLVIILGDVSFGARDETINQLNRLNGRKWLIPGNHDARMHKDVVDACFERVLPPIQDIKGEHPEHGKFRFTLCHFPIMSWNMAHHGSIHLHGHSHGNLDMKRVRNRLTGALPRMMDVGIDTHPIAWAPYNLEEVLLIMGDRQHVTVDHHKHKEPA